MARIRAICIPSSDQRFSDVVQGALAADASISSPAQLEDALRPAYPEIRVQPRQLSGELESIWYVYRNRGFSSAVRA